MDEPDVDPRALAGALDHVAGINRWLGSRRALLRRVPESLPDPGTAPAFAILDVGTGSADLPIALLEAADRLPAMEVTAVDRHPATLRHARHRTRATPGIRLVRADGLRLPFPTAAFDLAMASMTLHHMEGDQRCDLLAEMARVARGGRVLIGEPERCLPNYLGARLLAATIWRSNPVTRHDAPLSVRRSFTPAELVQLAVRAGLRSPRVHRHFFFRLVLVADA